MTDAQASDHGGTGPGLDLSAGLLLDIRVEDGRWSAAVPGLIDVCTNAGQAAFRASGTRPTDAEAALVLADDTFVAGLNRRYRNRDGATNVLSFAARDTAKEPADGPSGMSAMLGDIAIAYDTVVREAAENGISVENHLRHLVVHGVLHLLGYDHTSDEQAAIMEPLETSVLECMGVDDPHAADNTPETAAEKGNV